MLVFFVFVINIVLCMYIVLDFYFKGCNYVYVNYDILGFVLLVILCYVFFRLKWNKLKSYLKWLLLLSLFNYLCNKVEFVVNLKLI